VGFLSRKREETYTPPPPPSEELVEAVREVEETAEHQLDRAKQRDEEVNRHHARSGKIKKENKLGQRFWQAVGETRGT
jgi:hypothetical protein